MFSKTASSSGAARGILSSCGRVLPNVCCLLSLYVAFSIDVRAAEPSVGLVTRVENEAEVVSGGASTTALVGTVVHLSDQLRTGPDARLQVAFRDSTTLTLGEKAIVVIDRYVYDPDAGTGEAAIDATKGAIRFATGKLQNLGQKTITVSTPVAAVGVRGTEFWSGRNSVLLIKPAVTVSNKGGSVTIDLPWQGTTIKSQTTAPSQPVFWTAAMIADALSTTDFQGGSGPQQPKQQQTPPQKGGQTTPPNPQYALAKPAMIAGLFVAIPFVSFLVSSQDDGPASP